MEHKQNNQMPQSHNSHTSMDDERVLPGSGPGGGFGFILQKAKG